MSVELTEQEVADLWTEWTAALRSGKYKQGRRYLHQITNGEHEYCCLGVLCDVANKRHPGLLRYDDENGWFSYDSQGAILPAKLAELMGISAWGTYTDCNGRVVSLTAMNDYEGSTFEQIADVLDSKPQWIRK